MDRLDMKQPSWVSAFEVAINNLMVDLEENESQYVDSIDTNIFRKRYSIL